MIGPDIFTAIYLQTATNFAEAFRKIRAEEMKTRIANELNQAQREAAKFQSRLAAEQQLASPAQGQE